MLNSVGQSWHSGVIGMIFFMGLIVLTSIICIIVRIVDFKNQDSKLTAIGLVIAHIIVFCLSVMAFFKDFWFGLVL